MRVNEFKKRISFLASSVFSLEYAAWMGYACICVSCSRDYNLSELPNDAEIQVCAYCVKKKNKKK